MIQDVRTVMIKFEKIKIRVHKKIQEEIRQRAEVLLKEGGFDAIVHAMYICNVLAVNYRNKYHVSMACNVILLGLLWIRI